MSSFPHNSSSGDHFNTPAHPTSKLPSLPSENNPEMPRLPDSQSKDGLIRMLLQNATPTPPPTSSASMGPPPTNLPPIPRWPPSPMIPVVSSPGSVSLAPPISSPKVVPTTTSTTTTTNAPSTSVQLLPPSALNLITVDVTTEDQNPAFIHQISEFVSFSNFEAFLTIFITCINFHIC